MLTVASGGGVRDVIFPLLADSVGAVVLERRF